MRIQSNLKQVDTNNPPRLIASLLAGFDVIARHITLVILPFVLDLFLWCGPQLKINRLIHTLSDTFLQLPGAGSTETTQFIEAGREMWQWVGTRFNLFIFLRSYPVGVPSLMSSRLPINTPDGINSISWEITAPLMILASWFLLSLFGLGLGTFYFDSISRAATARSEKPSFHLSNCLRQLVQVFWLTLIFEILALLVSLPAICLISLLALGSPALGQLAMLLYGGGVIWLLFPLIFSPHGIFINQQNVIQSLRRGVVITRMTLPTTGLLFLVALLLSQGLDLLWSSPAETSWFSLVGIAGHAFVTTGLLATSFVYYEKADKWSQRVITQHLTQTAIQ